MRLRLATTQDTEAICAIYNYAVTYTTATFDLVPRSLDEQRAWITARSGGFGALVAENADGDVVGFAALSPYKERAAYRTSVENSLYVDQNHHGQGIGRFLLTATLDVAKAHGFHTVIARIESSGAVSRGLHASCGFELAGIEREIGRKFGRWLDVVVMQYLVTSSDPFS
jgi:L-amino acid N-acyltransferase